MKAFSPGNVVVKEEDARKQKENVEKFEARIRFSIRNSFKDIMNDMIEMDDI